MKIKDLQKLGAIRGVEKKEIAISVYTDEPIYNREHSWNSGFNTCRTLFTESEVDFGKVFDEKRISEIMVLFIDKYKRENEYGYHPSTKEIAEDLLQNLNKCIKEKKL